MMKMVQRPLLLVLMKLRIEILPMGTIERLLAMSLEHILLERIKQNQLSDFAQKQSLCNKFCQNIAFQGLLWLRSDSSKVVLIPNEYLNI